MGLRWSIRTASARTIGAGSLRVPRALRDDAMTRRRVRGASRPCAAACHSSSSFAERYRSGQTGQTVNLLAIAFGGSNPPLSTHRTQMRRTAGLEAGGAWSRRSANGCRERESFRSHAAQPATRTAHQVDRAREATPGAENRRERKRRIDTEETQIETQKRHRREKREKKEERGNVEQRGIGAGDRQTHRGRAPWDATRTADSRQRRPAEVISGNSSVG